MNTRAITGTLAILAGIQQVLGHSFPNATAKQDIGLTTTSKYGIHFRSYGWVRYPGLNTTVVGTVYMTVDLVSNETLSESFTISQARYNGTKTSWMRSDTNSMGTVTSTVELQNQPGGTTSTVVIAYPMVTSDQPSARAGTTGPQDCCQWVRSMSTSITDPPTSSAVTARNSAHDPEGLLMSLDSLPGTVEGMCLEWMTTLAGRNSTSTCSCTSCAESTSLMKFDGNPKGMETVDAYAHIWATTTTTLSSIDTARTEALKTGLIALEPASTAPTPARPASSALVALSRFSTTSTQASESLTLTASDLEEPPDSPAIPSSSNPLVPVLVPSTVAPGLPTMTTESTTSPVPGHAPVELIMDALNEAMADTEATSTAFDEESPDPSTTTRTSAIAEYVIGVLDTSTSIPTQDSVRSTISRDPPSPTTEVNVIIIGGNTLLLTTSVDESQQSNAESTIGNDKDAPIAVNDISRSQPARGHESVSSESSPSDYAGSISTSSVSITAERPTPATNLHSSKATELISSSSASSMVHIPSLSHWVLLTAMLITLLLFVA